MRALATGCVCAVLCPGLALAYECPATTFSYTPGSAIIDNDGPDVIAEADKVVSDNGMVSLDGNTVIRYQGRELSAENARYDPATGEVVIAGSLRFLGQGIDLESRNATFDLDDNLFVTGKSRYQIDVDGKRATGSADGMSRDPDGVFALDGATYSSCPPGDESWFISASEINLYPDDGIGTARDIVLRFKGVPLLAVPTFSFPISPKRKTGFLAPVLARGESTGLELLIPWYWNIRPNMDATLTPRLTSQRGVQAQTEFRYLNTQGNWVLDNEYLADSKRDGESRHFTRIRHEGYFGDYWQSAILASRVSDKDYFYDLGDSLQLASITHLEQRADLSYRYGPVDFRARLQSYQTVDEAIVADERPYRRLPQFTLDLEAPRQPLGIRSQMHSELVYFDRSDSVTGTRFDIAPRLSLPLRGDAWFFTPSLSHRFTFYALNNLDDTVDNRHSRNTNTLALDGGLYFDRTLDASGAVQTLEPRLFYLRVPYTDQDALPVFDSSAFDFSISQLFRENRFTGADRIADANQLSFALTSRTLDGEGRERLRASIGQILYFDDRRVTLDDTGLETGDSSDLVGEVSMEFNRHWLAKGNLQWNPDNDRTVRGSLLLSYRPAPDRIVNVAHRSVNTGNSAETEQIDISGLWPIGNSWRIAGRWNFSLDADTSIDSLLGLEYESCCWAVRLAARRYITDDGLDHDTSAYLQLVLKGLAPLGQDYGALLENAILGYQDQYDK